MAACKSSSGQGTATFFLPGLMDFPYLPQVLDSQRVPATETFHLRAYGARRPSEYGRSTLDGVGWKVDDQ